MLKSDFYMSLLYDWEWYVGFFNTKESGGYGFSIGVVFYLHLTGAGGGSVDRSK